MFGLKPYVGTALNKTPSKGEDVLKNIEKIDHVMKEPQKLMAVRLKTKEKSQSAKAQVKKVWGALKKTLLKK